MWERKGWVSLWAGVVPADEFKRLFVERYDGRDSPISFFANALRINYYEREQLQFRVTANPTPLRAMVGTDRYDPREATFAELIPADARALDVTAIALLYDTDFTQRPRNALRGKLAYVGSFPYRK